MALIPMVIDNDGNGERSYDIYSRMLKDRIIFFNDEVNEHTAGLAIAQLLFLNAQDPEADIYMYINSPGGSVIDGLGVVDVMNYISNDVVTITTGLAASMGSILLSQGTPGKRFALPNSEVLIHQVLGGARGQASDIEIAAKHTLKLKEKLNRMLAESTNGKVSYEEMVKLTDRDNWLSAEEALEMGLIDKIIKHQNEVFDN